MRVDAASSADIDCPRLGAARAADDAERELPLCGWGLYPVIVGRERQGEDLERITRDVVLTRGNGRSYGDASLPPPNGGRVARTILGDRILGFEPDSGVIRVEAGILLRSLNRVFLPRGWISPVSPGTALVTIGGMVASDVHGKSHHVDGTFGEHVRAIRMRVADGSIVECTESREPDLFRATLGGMGLTGHILEVEFTLRRVPSSWIYQETERLPDIDAVVDHLKQASAAWPYTLTWVDCFSRGASLGRGILMKGRWAEPSEAARAYRELPNLMSVPFLLPGWLPRTFGVQLFNRFLYWQHGAATKRGIVHPTIFFYPLDIVRDWNRLYGRRGFAQYQCVLPVQAGDPVLRRLLEILQRRGTIPYVNVVKDCGAQGRGTLSFPMPGITFALDIPVDDRLQRVVDELNELVIGAGGRIYLTKDAFTRAAHFRAMEPRLDEFRRIRRMWDPHGRLKSAQSIRVLGDTP